jgi:hypothetical protein
MTNRMGAAWPLNSPAFDPYKELNMAATAYNTSAQSNKYGGGGSGPYGGSHSIFSEIKNNHHGGGVAESPQMARKFMDFEPNHLGTGRLF